MLFVTPVVSRHSVTLAMSTGFMKMISDNDIVVIRLSSHITIVHYRALVCLVVAV